MVDVSEYVAAGGDMSMVVFDKLHARQQEERGFKRGRERKRHDSFAGIIQIK